MINGKDNISKEELFMIKLSGQLITITYPDEYNCPKEDPNYKFFQWKRLLCITREYKKLHDVGLVTVTRLVEDEVDNNSKDYIDSWTLLFLNDVKEQEDTTEMNMYRKDYEDYVDSSLWVIAFNVVFDNVDENIINLDSDDYKHFFG